VKPKSQRGDSFLYVFVEESWYSEPIPFFKIGIVTHNTTDDGISKSEWPKYEQHDHPVSIARRLFKLMNGNPRKIIPLMWLKFETNNCFTGLQLSKKIETKWLRIFKSWDKDITKNDFFQSQSSTEWFQTKLGDLKKIVAKIIEEESGNYKDFYILENAI